MILRITYPLPCLKQEKAINFPRARKPQLAIWELKEYLCPYWLMENAFQKRQGANTFINEACCLSLPGSHIARLSSLREDSCGYSATAHSSLLNDPSPRGHVAPLTAPP